MFTYAYVQLDAPLEAGTDSSSVAVITFYRGRNLIVGNSFSDCGPVTLGGAAFNSVFARNTLARSEGFRVISETFGSSAWMVCSYMIVLVVLLINVSLAVVEY